MTVMKTPSGQTICIMADISMGAYVWLREPQESHMADFNIADSIIELSDESGVSSVRQEVFGV